MADQVLPEADGLYIGGGYPELYGHELAADAPMREAVRTFARSGRPVYAECGGLMYLAESLTDLDGHVWPMAGVLPVPVVMERSRLVVGYREVTLTSAGPLGPAGTRARGHEFHCSKLGDIPAAITRLTSSSVILLSGPSSSRRARRSPWPGWRAPPCACAATAIFPRSCLPSDRPSSCPSVLPPATMMY